MVAEAAGALLGVWRVVTNLNAASMRLRGAEASSVTSHSHNAT
jgi:hypothetical protein